MKQIDNYILEKLHISKDLKLTTPIEKFKNVFEDNGYYIFTSAFDKPNESLDRGIAMTIQPKGKVYPYIFIDMFKNYWVQFGDDANGEDYFTDKEKFNRHIVIFNNDTNKTYYVSDFDIVEEEGYAYTEENAKKLLELLTKH